MKLNVSVSIQNGKKPSVKCNRTNIVSSNNDSATQQCIELLAKNIDEVREAVLHLAKTSAVKPEQEDDCDSCDCCDDEIVEDEDDDLIEVYLEDYGSVKIVNQNLILLNGEKFKVVEAYDNDDNQTTKLKQATRVLGYWRD